MENQEILNGAPMTDLNPAKKSKPRKAKPSKRSAAASKRSGAKKLAKKKAGAKVATKTRSGKKIHRAKPGGKGEMAKKGSFALVAHIPRDLHAKAWATVKRLQKKDPSLSLSSWLQSVIARASK